MHKKSLHDIYKYEDLNEVWQIWSHALNADTQFVLGN